MTGERGLRVNVVVLQLLPAVTAQRHRGAEPPVVPASLLSNEEAEQEVRAVDRAADEIPRGHLNLRSHDSQVSKQFADRVWRPSSGDVPAECGIGGTAIAITNGSDEQPVQDAVGGLRVQRLVGPFTEQNDQGQQHDGSP